MKWCKIIVCKGASNLWGGDIAFVARNEVQYANLHIYIIRWQLWDVGNFHMIYIEDIIHYKLFTFLSVDMEILTP